MNRAGMVALIFAMSIVMLVFLFELAIVMEHEFIKVCEGY